MTYTPLDQIESFLQRFIIYPSVHALTVHVLWIAHTYLMECWDTTPRLGFMSAEKESGKSKALEMTALFVANPELFLNASPAALVRIINQGHAEGNIPTILHDEIDNVFRGGTADPNNATLLAIFNQGYTPGATVPRCVGQGTKYQVDRMPCYCPVAFAGLRKLPDTLGSRTIHIRMKRRAKDEAKESFRRKRHVPQAEPIRDALSTWCMQHAAEIEEACSGEGPEMPDGIEDRTADCWEPLFAIASVAGGDWPARVWNAAKNLTGAAVEDTVTTGVELLEHVRDAFFDADRIWTSTLLDRLRNREESPWKDMGKGKELDDRTLANMLGEYGIKSSKQVKIDQVNRRGYLRADFEDAWKRYLPPSATGATSASFLNNKTNLVAEVALRGMETDEYEERAAILEYDADLSRDEAEAQAADEYPDMPDFLRRAG
jgi:hypothetical protein